MEALRCMELIGEECGVKTIRPSFVGLASYFVGSVAGSLTGDSDAFRFTCPKRETKKR
jgi:hypothetical protein